MSSLSVLRGDITRVEMDAIVNAANEYMLGGGGVDGAIHAAAGPELLAACRDVPEVRPGVRCPTGEARITPGFRLSAKYVIHTVGPRWRGGGSGETELLASAYRNSLVLARDYPIRSIAFPAISTGVFGFPLVPACRIAVSECLAFLNQGASPSEIVLVAFSKEDADTLSKVLAEVRGLA